MSGSVHILTSTIFDNTGTIYGTIVNHRNWLDDSPPLNQKDYLSLSNQRLNQITG